VPCEWLRSRIARLRLGLPLIRGGVDKLPDEASVRERLRIIVEGGVLRRVQPSRVWAGRCSETHRCVACSTAIEVGETEFDLILSAGVKVFFHPRCMNLWPNGVRDRNGVAGDSRPDLPLCALCRTPIKSTSISTRVYARWVPEGSEPPAQPSAPQVQLAAGVAVA
jgi:hypothetical protein